MHCVMKSTGESLVRCWADAFGGKDSQFDFMAETTANSVIVGITRTEAISRHGQEFLDRIMEEIMPFQSFPRVGGTGRCCRSHWLVV